MDYRIELHDTAVDALRRAIAEPLIRHNEALAGPGHYTPLVLALRDAAGQALGGLWASTGYGWLYVQMLYVPEALRGQGVGQRLMQQAEQEARRRGCRQAWVDTQFGARAFYERLGYTVFGELPEYPPGFVRSFLRKRLPD
ncbi:MAG: GNAT family N-acetyltransferase [Hylemonella sp.]